MNSFTRYAAVAVVVLSLGFLVASAPLANDITIPAIIGRDPVSLACSKLAVDIEAHLKTLFGCTTLADAQVVIQAIVSLLQICADDFLKIGAEVVVEAEAKASIVACFVAMITLLLRACVHLSIRIGLAAVVALCAQVDVVLKVFFVSLNVCLDGIVALIAKDLASTVAGSFAQLQFKLCMGVLGL